MTIRIRDRPWNIAFRTFGADWFARFADLIDLSASDVRQLQSQAREFTRETVHRCRATWDERALMEHEAALRHLDAIQAVLPHVRHRVELFAALLSADVRTSQLLYDWFDMLDTVADEGVDVFPRGPLPEPPAEVRELIRQTEERLGPRFGDYLHEDWNVLPESTWDHEHNIVWEPEYEITIVKSWEGHRIPLVTLVLLFDQQTLLTADAVDYLRHRAKPDRPLVTWRELQDAFSVTVLPIEADLDWTDFLP